MLSYMLAILLSVFGGQPVVYNSTTGTDNISPENTIPQEEPNPAIQYISRPGH